MRAKVKHPSDAQLAAVVGFNRTKVGFFAEVRQGGKLIEEYDSLTSDQTTLRGVFQVLIKHGFISQDDLTEAIGFLAEMSAEKIQDDGVRRAAEVLEKLKSAAGE